MATGLHHVYSSNLVFSLISGTFLRAYLKSPLQNVGSETQRSPAARSPTAQTLPATAPWPLVTLWLANARFINRSDIPMETECEAINRGLAPPNAEQSAEGDSSLSVCPPKARGHSVLGGGRERVTQEGQAEGESPPAVRKGKRGWGRVEQFWDRPLLAAQPSSHCWYPS